MSAWNELSISEKIKLTEDELNRLSLQTDMLYDAGYSHAFGLIQELERQSEEVYKELKALRIERDAETR